MSAYKSRITLHTSPGSSCSVDFDPAVFIRLLFIYRHSREASIEQLWLVLEAMHVLGQTRFYPHLHTHVLMLGLGWRTRDWSEVLGQLARLLLVPLGHVLGRLPLGNSGRSNISAFRHIPVRQDIADVITQASSSSR